MKLRNLFLIFIISLFVASCGGGSSSDSKDNNTDIIDDATGDPLGPDPDQPPAISGFEYPLAKGDFWEYGWDYQSSYFAAYGSSSYNADSRFRITLGDPITVDGTQFYEMLLSGNTLARDSKDLKPNGKYVAISDYQLIILESDMVTEQVLFDAQTGVWPGSGFFTDFPSSTLFEATLSSINNDYISQTAYQVKESSSSSQCEYFSGIGTICGGDYNEDLVEREYYVVTLGPVGYYGHFSISDWSSSDGGWSSSNTTNIGLIAASLRGDTVDYDLEVEPNNQIAQATAITLPARIKGDNVSEDDLGGTTPVSLGVVSLSEIEPNDSPVVPQAIDIPSLLNGSAQVGDGSTSVDVQTAPSGGTNYTASFEDWYEVTLGTGKTLDVSLNFPATGADLDMYLFSLENSSTVITHANSIEDNVATGIYNEQMSTYLTADTYYVAIDAYNTPSGNANYSLSLSTGDSAVDIGDWFRFSLVFQTEVVISVSGGSSFVLTDNSGSTTLASGGVTGVGITLEAGSYLIGVSDDGDYTLEVSTL